MISDQAPLNTPHRTGIDHGVGGCRAPARKPARLEPSLLPPWAPADCTRQQSPVGPEITVSDPIPMGHGILVTCCCPSKVTPGAYCRDVLKGGSVGLCPDLYAEPQRVVNLQQFVSTPIFLENNGDFPRLRNGRTARICFNRMS